MAQVAVGGAVAYRPATLKLDVRSFGFAQGILSRHSAPQPWYNFEPCGGSHHALAAVCFVRERLKRGVDTWTKK